ncbi:indolepyruvate oxidoreductase subunit beta [Natroniella sulfidigena]|uniref:indolepyruvate oxidoreductase subunit beta n=1 Tax=Natroniella sulfidigena TaxID=723921 RepID=UPI00200A9798|nr:indolepyruvate oxidoreductase subunit beta [Natroniella sulfidigena]MCK8817908.1 indolepyruvate oxidoreductase subunit beta [Natroniella sulfidigena]
MDIIIAAVGGQGALLASKVLGRLAQNKGLDVKMSEVHGMAQRGGSVITHVRFAEEVNSPLIEEGSADVVLALEMLEGARYISYLKPGGKLITNTQKIDPMSVIIGQQEYPAELKEQLSQLDLEIITEDALGLAKEAGNMKAANIALMGVLAKNTEIEKEEWLTAIKEIVPEKFQEVNITAFELGFNSEV